MHVLGFFHEQQRLDRDDHVVIHPQLVNDPNYARIDQMFGIPDVWDDMGSPYDFHSIMHYGGQIQTHKGVRAPNIGKISKPHEPIEEFRTDTFSEQDIIQINHRYPCGINECETGQHNCGNNSKCVNDIDTFHCECFVGYEDQQGWGRSSKLAIESDAHKSSLNHDNVPKRAPVKAVALILTNVKEEHIIVAQSNVSTLEVLSDVQLL